MVELLARELFNVYDSFKLEEIASKHFTQTELFKWLQPFEHEQVFTKTVLGKSGEGRSIYLLTIGNGQTKILIWSQMHGDEPTATMALVDMCSFFAKNPSHIITTTIREKLTLLMIPMLNPDGAEHFIRRTAQLIDMNRDALALTTPEARILGESREKYQPTFGFNLHDQEPYLTVGMSKKITAIALLAPASDESHTDTIVRVRAKRVASVIASVMNLFIANRIAKWDDSYEPRAFGDNIQKCGTSTVLIESGGWKDDPNKFFIRKLNCIGLLMTLYVIATEKYREFDLSIYEQLPPNTKLGCDYIIRNAVLKTCNHIPSVHVDVGINFEERKNSETGQIDRFAKIVELGDLSTFTALEEMDAHSAELDENQVKLEIPFPASKVQFLLNRK